ncbi:hypothetical protein J6A31_09195 [bacterium]|nr:hypothetical protein [bacterium]
MYLETSKHFKKTISISKKTAEWIEKMLNVEPKDESECFGENEKYSESVVFENGYEVSIEMCGVRYNPGEVNTAWTQAVLYKDGNEISFTPPYDEFTGEWEVYDDAAGLTFHINVTVEK